jgi:hypothetical protein
MDADGMESLTTGTDNAVVDFPIRSIEDVHKVEMDLLKRYAEMIKVTGSRLVSLKVITWRPFDE